MSKKAPFPTMTEITDFLRTKSGKVGKREIARAFQVRGDDKVRLKEMLKSMKKSGDIDFSGKKIFSSDGLPENCPAVITGVDSDGELIARPLEWAQKKPAPQILITDLGRLRPPPAEGDHVLLKIKPAGKHFFHGAVVRRLTASPNRIVGIFESNGSKGGRIVSLDRRLHQEYFVDKEAVGLAKNGDLVIAHVSSDSLKAKDRFSKKARITEVVGSSLAPKSASLIAILMHNIPVDFSEQALKFAKKATLPDLKNREDLRNLPLLTVDGEDARDFDDAVFAEPDTRSKNKDGYHLIVAIADVAWFVRPDNPLDICARQRGNSVYFPDRVVPMLPEELSTGLCSLQEGKDRPCLAAHLWIDGKGRLIKSKFTRAMICSVARLNYDEVQAVFDGKSSVSEDLKQPILNLKAVYDLLAQQRCRRHALEIDVPEMQIDLDQNGQVANITPRQRFDSHKMIEEMMILANVAAAQTLEKLSMPVMYRVHEAPDAEKVFSLHRFLSSIGISSPKAGMNGKDFNDIMTRCAGTPRSRMINELILRTQCQARYSPENLGHFGLALEKYAHFTSPIRRYADLMVHRALIEGLNLGRGALFENGSAINFEDIGEHISETERRASSAERDAQERYLAAYMKDKIGQRFSVVISGVSRFGLFVKIDDIGAEGLVPVSSLPGYFKHDEEIHRLVDEKTGLFYELGQTISVFLQEALPVTGGLIFSLAEKPKIKTTKNKIDKNKKKGMKKHPHSPKKHKRK